ncbi:MAG: T9SS type A sorting domain-containing protein [Melioribacteraceae bacterium]|nr:T9SS type A sorting domain-containing protein [Melioribacteraceae bacterium]MCF8355571.1 T9SS type A sorting domain-containing protein [Melioribacteraceae bacterium]MCF8395050.1 T9SS type A sorting domain-containing protein [Melioribacteraceae bacterium]MCF8420504.1 T9SS type A sorting domain-containing protein [Melioribacteraceae bacterium]
MNKYKFLLSVSFFLLLQTAVSAQNWQWLGPDSSSVYFVYANDDTVYIKSDNNYKSTDGGITWNILDDTDPEFGGGFFLLNVDPQNSNRIFVTDWNGKLWSSTDGGNNWELLTDGTEPWTENQAIKKLYVSPHNENIIFIILSNGSWENLIRTTDSGETWDDLGTFGGAHGSEITFAFDPINSSRLYAVTNDFMFYDVFIVSNDLGESWSIIKDDVSAEWILVDHENNDRIYLFPYMMRSDDGGDTWHTINEGIFADSYLTSIIDPYDSTVLYMSTNYGVYKTTNMGEYWELMEGSESLELNFLSYYHFDNLYIDSLTNKLYIGTKKGVYVYNLLTSIEREDETIPNEIALKQNYPNPFNPSTKISFTVPSSSNVTIKVFDILGREIQTLINKSLSPGNYEVEFNGVGLPSGLYIYKLIAGNYSSAKKMILLR